ncbi:MAG: glycosyltransferase family 2 protein [Gemmataceae bacterium]
MQLFEIYFWVGVGITAYACVGYPLLIWALAKVFPATPGEKAPMPESVSVVLCVKDEENRIVGRLRELLCLVNDSPYDGEIIVVSDGSTDNTVELARGFRSNQIHVIELDQNVGKAAALTIGCQQARHDILVFADVRQRWASDALVKLVSHFQNADVGAVSGELVIETRPGVITGVGFYWRYEKWIRHQESQRYSMVGLTGAISAVRRELFRPIPPGTLLDDVYWPMQVLLQRKRVILDRGAIAYDQLPEKAADEFKRKVRTLTGNYQLVTRLPDILIPGRNPVWFEFVSHKLMRLVMPWALLMMLASCVLINLPFYNGILYIQIAFYVIGLLGLWTGLSKKSKIASAAGSFIVLNVAAWVAFWVWVTGRADRSWRKVHYTPESKSMPVIPTESARV